MEKPNLHSFFGFLLFDSQVSEFFEVVLIFSRNPIVSHCIHCSTWKNQKPELPEAFYGQLHFIPLQARDSLFQPNFRVHQLQIQPHLSLILENRAKEIVFDILDISLLLARKLIPKFVFNPFFDFNPDWGTRRRVPMVLP